MGSQKKKPHLIYIVADQLRYDMLGKGFTPHIDAIGQDGVMFQKAYCASPLCVPSRGALFTGTYPNVNGSLINPWHLPDAVHGDVHGDVEHIYGLMEQCGWECIHSGKQHLFTEGGKLENNRESRTRWASTEESYREFLKEHGAPMPGGGSFRSPVPEMAEGKYTRVCLYSNADTGCYEAGKQYYFDEYFTDQAVKAMSQRKEDMPLFLSAMFLAPHPPLEIPEPYYSKFLAEEVTLPDNVGIWYENQSPLQMYNLTGVIGARYTLEQWRETWRVYQGLVKLLDDCVGRLINELKRQGIYDDSLIIFTSDHGEMLGSHRLFQKMCMYEESVRTPVYMKFPQGQYKGTVVNEPVSHIDVHPTICEYLGIGSMKTVNGRSLLQVLEGMKHEDPVYIQFDGNGARGNFQRCIIKGNYKLIADVFKDEIYYELYDIEKDPMETENLIFTGGCLAEAEDLLLQLKQHMERTKDMICLTMDGVSEFVGRYS